MTEKEFDNYKFYYGTEIQLENNEWIRVKYVNFDDRTINDIKIRHIKAIRTIFN